jgi:hypothetical protein
VDGVGGYSVTVCYQYRMLWRRIFALSLALMALAAPTPSFAQNAGQDQYQDPLAGGDGSGSTGDGGSTGGGSAGGGGSTSGGSTGGGSTSGTPTTTPAATTPGTTGTGTTTSPTATAAQAPGELPRTGFDVILTFELGLAMLLLGLVSHRVLVLRDRRH